MKSTVRFVNKQQSTFFPTLRKRVDMYFRQNNISKTGGNRIVFKIVFMLLLYFVPYFLILTGSFNLIQMLVLVIIMGLGVAGVGLSVMHDANHGSLFDKKWLNKVFGNTMFLLGGDTNNWKIQHNVLHHTYTNIHEIDEDIETKFIIRLSPHAALKKIHQYQHLYAFPLYGMMTFSLLFKDFTKAAKYYRKGLLKGGRKIYRKYILEMILSKSIYFMLFLILPILILNIAWWQVLIGFVIMHLVAGMILSIIFQMAHVVENTDHPDLNLDGDIENTWAIHQMQTTANFANRNKLLTWFCGGLNYQIEHHLFPNICHVHYPEISQIVKETAREYQVPYFHNETFPQAVVSHFKMLKKLGSLPPKEKILKE